MQAVIMTRASSSAEAQGGAKIHYDKGFWQPRDDRLLGYMARGWAGWERVWAGMGGYDANII